MTDVTKNLYWVFTKYGKERLANFSPEDKLFLQKIKIGDYNWFEDGAAGKNILPGGYSEQAFKDYFAENDNDLESPIENGEFPISGKTILGPKTIELSSLIPETFGNCTIRELGVYEVIAGEDHLFAVCTLQGIYKPDIATNHYISSRFDIILTSEMLAESYDSIILNPSSNFATMEQISTFQHSLLFVESNLAEQISNNAHIIGLNRPQQIFDKILEDKKRFSNFAVSTSYANLLNTTTLKEVPAFWVFKPNKNLCKGTTIPDLGIDGIYLGADMLSTQYENGFEGLASWLNFSGEHHYRLESDIIFNLIKSDEVATDYAYEYAPDGSRGDRKPPEVTRVSEYRNDPFTFFWIGSHNDNKERVLLCKDNSANKDDDNPPEFSFKITDKGQVEVKLFTNRENYVIAKTYENTVPVDEFYVLSITYTGKFNEPEPFKIFVNSEKLKYSVEFTKGVDNFKGMPVKKFKELQIPLLSYNTSASGNFNYINSKTSLITLVKAELNDDYIKATIFNLMALIGKNPCLE